MARFSHNIPCRILQSSLFSLRAENSVPFLQRKEKTDYATQSQTHLVKLFWQSKTV